MTKKKIALLSFAGALLLAAAVALGNYCYTFHTVRGVYEYLMGKENVRVVDGKLQVRYRILNYAPRSEDWYTVTDETGEIEGAMESEGPLLAAITKVHPEEQYGDYPYDRYDDSDTYPPYRLVRVEFTYTNVGEFTENYNLSPIPYMKINGGWYSMEFLTQHATVAMRYDLAPGESVERNFYLWNTRYKPQRIPWGELCMVYRQDNSEGRVAVPFTVE